MGVRGRLNRKVSGFDWAFGRRYGCVGVCDADALAGGRVGQTRCDLRVI